MALWRFKLIYLFLQNQLASSVQPSCPPEVRIVDRLKSIRPLLCLIVANTAILLV